MRLAGEGEVEVEAVHDYDNADCQGQARLDRHDKRHAFNDKHHTQPPPKVITSFFFELFMSKHHFVEQSGLNGA